MFQNQYKYYKNPKVSILDPAYYFAKLFALLSISKISKNHNRILVSPFDSNRGVEFYSISYWSFAYTTVSVLVMCYTLHACVFLINYPCVGMSDCAAWILTASHSILAIVLLITSVFRTKASVDCFNKGRELLAWNPSDSVEFSHWNSVNFLFFLLILVLRCLCAVVAQRHTSIHTNVAFYLYVLCLIYPVAVECVVCSMCYVIQVCLERINERLEFIHQLQFKESKQISLHIEEFMDLHWKSFELAHITTQTFGVDLLFDLSFSMIWFVIYVYITIASLANLQLGGMTSDEVLSEVARNLGLLLELCFVTLRIFYTCHRAQQMSSPAQKSIKILRDLGRGNHLKDGCRDLIDAYSTQILERKMKLEACDFFTVDMSFIHGIVGVATTYLIVFIQYNTS